MTQEAQPQPKSADNADVDNVDENAATEADSGRESAAASADRPTRSFASRLAAPLSMLLLGIMAGALAFPLINVTHDFFDIPPELQVHIPPYPPEIAGQVDAASKLAINLNMALSFGLCGGLVCMATGLGAGLLGRSARAAIWGLVAGVVLGCLFGAIGGVANRFVEQQLNGNGMEASYKAMLIHGPVWLLIGMAAGVVVGAASRCRKKLVQCAVAGLFAAVVAVVLYPLACAVLFPSAHPELRIPDQAASRLFWTTMSAGLIALAIGRQAFSHE